MTTPAEGTATPAPVAALPSIEEIASQIQAAKGAPPAADPPAVTTPDPAPAPASAAAPVTTPVEAGKKPDPQAARFAALSRREKDARTREQAISQREQEIAARAESENARIAADAAKLAAAKKATRPLEAMRELGFTMEQITMDALGKYEPKAPDPMDTKLGERLTPLETQLAAAQELLKQQSQQLEAIQIERAEAAKRDVRREIVDTAKTRNCDVINAMGNDGYMMVENVMREFWNQNKKMLSYSEACDKVEAYYTDYVSSLVEKTGKLKSKFAPAPVVPAAKTAPTKPTADRPRAIDQSLSQGTGANRVDIDTLSRTDALAHLATQLRFK